MASQALRNLRPYDSVVSGFRRHSRESINMNSFDDFLHRELLGLEEQDLLRSLRRIDSPQGTRIRIGGREFLNFSSNDYLGLAEDPRLKAAAAHAIEKYGVGSGASRLISGS